MNDLNPLEVRLVEGCRNGIPLICEPGASQSIRAEIIRTLCLGLRSDWRAPRGVRITNAVVVGQLDLEDADISNRLILEQCVLDGGINLRFARGSLISLEGCKLGAVLAARLFVKHNLILENAVVRGKLELRQAVIEGQLFADGLTIVDPAEGVAVYGDGIRVKGDIFLRRSNIQGEIRFPGAQIGGDLEFDGAR